MMEVLLSCSLALKVGASTTLPGCHLIPMGLFVQNCYIHNAPTDHDYNHYTTTLIGLLRLEATLTSHPSNARFCPVLPSIPLSSLRHKMHTIPPFPNLYL